MQLTIHGARGSTSVSGPDVVRYGGDTTCFAVRVTDTHVVLIDVGSGVHMVQRSLPSMAECRFTVFLTHYHWDHIMGLPMFAPAWSAGNHLAFYGRGSEDEVRRSLGDAIRPPWFPVSLVESPAQVEMHTSPETMEVGPLRVSSISLHHPQGVLGYRIDGPEASIVIATDHEAGTEADERLVAFARGADVLVHDAQYTGDEIEAKRGWGHSTWQDAVAAAEAAGVSRLVLTSHDPMRTDDEIDAIVARARVEFPNTDAAHPVLTLPL